MAEENGAVKGTASMWALSSDKKTVRLTVPALSAGDPLVSALWVEFDRTSLEATLSMLVRMHFEMMRTTPAELPYVKH
jgi:hypothetical protein